MLQSNHLLSQRVTRLQLSASPFSFPPLRSLLFLGWRTKPIKLLKITTFFVNGRRKLITNNQHTAYNMLHCPYMNHSHQRPPQDKQLLTTPPTPTSMQLFLPQCRETCADITTRYHLHASVSRLEQSEGERLRRCVQSASVGMPITRAKAEADTELWCFGFTANGAEWMDNEPGRR